MTDSAEWTPLLGTWRGTNHLWLMPGAPVHTSPATADVGVTAQGQFLELRYTWAYDGDPAEGRVIIGRSDDAHQVQAVWFDTWHMRDQFMVCTGAVDDSGVTRLDGSYAAPEGPDWGWQIEIDPYSAENFDFRMYNITPDGQKALAVEVRYAR